MGSQVDDLIACASLSLHLVHGGVGGMQQLLRIMVGLARKCDADAGGYLDADAGDHERSSESVDHPGRDRFHLFVPVQVFAQNYELVSGYPSDGIGRSKSTLEPLTYSYQQVISDLMAERIIDRFEVVKIGEEDRHDLSRPATANDGMVDSFQEQESIG